jgi:hypothetical protein
MNVEAVVERYVALRDRKAELVKAHKEQLQTIEDAMDKIENALLRLLNEQGVESMRTNAGTAYVTKKTNVSIADRDSFRRFLGEQDDPFVYLDLKASKTAVEEFRKAHEDLPPGLNWSEMRAVNVRR